MDAPFFLLVMYIIVRKKEKARVFLVCMAHKSTFGALFLQLGKMWRNVEKLAKIGLTSGKEKCIRKAGGGRSV